MGRSRPSPRGGNPGGGGMQRSRLALGAVIGVFAFAGTATAQGQEVSLDQYKATVAHGQYMQLLKRGLDVVAAKDVAGGRSEIDLVLSDAQARSLKAEGV